MSEATTPGAAAWFVQSGGRVWGPYPQARIENFVAEGRVAAETPIGASPAGPFVAAARQPRLQGLFRPPERGAWSVRAEEPPEPAAGPTLAPTRPMLVWTQIRGHGAERFETLLASHGQVVRIAEGLWLIRARVGPAGLRNALTRRIDPTDAVMVVETTLDQAHWFNVDGEIDRALRQLWTAPK